MLLVTPVMSWFVYLLQCADNSLYCGITNDLTKRIQTHNQGLGARYTRSRLPAHLVWYESCADRATASRREAKIKQLPRNSKLLLIAGGKLDC